MSIPLAVTSTTACVEITDEDGSDEVPTRGWVDWLHGDIDTISGATDVIWYMAYDADGDDPFTDEVTKAIVIGNTTATDGGVSTNFGQPWHLPAIGTAGSVWGCVASDAGTLNITLRLTHRRATR